MTREFSNAGLSIRQRLKAVTFDVDEVSANSLREALSGWQISNVYGATVTSLPCDWHPGVVDLLVVGVRENVTETLGLCRFLASCTFYSRDSEMETAETLDWRGGPLNRARRIDVPLFVLVCPGQETFVKAALEAGAHRCLMRPICAKDVTGMLAHAHNDNQPRRHTLNVQNDQYQEGGSQWAKAN